MIYQVEVVGIINSLLQNIILLFGIGFIFTAASSSARKIYKVNMQIFIGLLLGGVVYLIMLNP
jgi:uncharacterized membrane protein YdbT with pleckstrin-like domain